MARCPVYARGRTEALSEPMETSDRPERARNKEFWSISCFRLIEQGSSMEGVMVATTIYGIRNCDTMKKARAWLDEHGVAYTFHDYKTAGITAETLQGWVDKLGWEPLLNRAGTTFRKLPEADRTDLDAAKAVALMLAQPSMIKRPVLTRGDDIFVGFKPPHYQPLLAG